MVRENDSSESSSDWVAYIVHLLAINYGWSPRTILEEVHLSEAILYANMAKNHRIDHYLTLLAIAHNPQQKKPDQLFDMLNAERPGNLRYTGSRVNEYEPDKEGLARLKRKLQRTKGSKITSK